MEVGARPHYHSERECVPRTGAFSSRVFIFHRNAIRCSPRPPLAASSRCEQNASDNRNGFAERQQMIHIPVGHEHTVFASGSVLKEVHCEECACHFAYRLDRSASGTATSFIFFDNHDVRARARAAERANVKVARLLERDCDAVPCPECGHYQAHMYAAFRRGYRTWMMRWGIYILCIFAICLGITWLCSKNERFRDDPEQIQPFWSITIAVGVIGILLILARRVMAWLTDPNSCDQESRRQLGQSLAARKESTPVAVPPQSFRPSS